MNALNESEHGETLSNSSLACTQRTNKPACVRRLNHTTIHESVLSINLGYGVEP